MTYLEIKRKIVLTLLEKYKDQPTRTVARIARRDHPEFFSDVESARGTFRMYRGVLGVAKRNQVKMRKYYKNEH